MSLKFLHLLGHRPPVGQRVESIALPLSIQFAPQTCSWDMRRGRFVHVPDDPDAHEIPVELGVLDAWTVRNDFLQHLSEDQMLHFLRTTGVFAWPNESWTYEELVQFQTVINRLKDVSPLHWRASIFPTQKILEACIKHRQFKTAFWWSERSVSTSIRRSTFECHSAALISTTTVGALLATIHVDHLRGAKWQQCARCGKHFMVTGHRKKYCDYDCAHAAASAQYRLTQKEQVKRKGKARSTDRIVQ